MNFTHKQNLKNHYINNKTTKYQLHNNQNKKTLKTIKLFTQTKTINKPLTNLLNIQYI